MNRIAIIPARGGSKRIPRKNIRPFLGRPMIGYPIAVLQETGLFDRIVVSTDDREIARVAKNFGVEAPFLRPPELSDDYTGTGPVVAHAIEWLIAGGDNPDYVCCVYATSPLLQADYVRLGWEKLHGSDKQFAFSVTSFPFPVLRALRLTEQGGVAPLFPEYIPCRSQDLEPSYHDAGQFYWGRPQAFLDAIPMFSDAAIPVILPRHLVQDIDEEEDWMQAEQMYRAIHPEVMR